MEVAICVGRQDTQGLSGRGLWRLHLGHEGAGGLLAGHQGAALQVQPQLQRTGHHQALAGLHAAPPPPPLRERPAGFATPCREAQSPLIGDCSVRLPARALAYAQLKFSYTAKVHRGLHVRCNSTMTSLAINWVREELKLPHALPRRNRCEPNMTHAQLLHQAFKHNFEHMPPA